MTQESTCKKVAKNVAGQFKSKQLYKSMGIDLATIVAMTIVVLIFSLSLNTATTSFAQGKSVIELQQSIVSANQEEIDIIYSGLQKLLFATIALILFITIAMTTVWTYSRKFQWETISSNSQKKSFMQWFGSLVVISTIYLVALVITLLIKFLIMFIIGKIVGPSVEASYTMTMVNHSLNMLIGLALLPIAMLVEKNFVTSKPLLESISMMWETLKSKTKLLFQIEAVILIPYIVLSTIISLILYQIFPFNTLVQQIASVIILLVVLAVFRMSVIKEFNEEKRIKHRAN